jgi:hypothetical protein
MRVARKKVCEGAHIRIELNAAIEAALDWHSARRALVEVLQAFSDSTRPIFTLALFVVTPLRVIGITEHFTPCPIQGRGF